MKNGNPEIQTEKLKSGLVKISAPSKGRVFIAKRRAAFHWKLSELGPNGEREIGYCFRPTEAEQVVDFLARNHRESCDSSLMKFVV